jgi:hypothetical protein
MTMTKWFAIIVTGLLLAGCGGWDQDPFAGKDESLKNGWPFPTKPVGTQPVNPEVINITAPYFVSYEEERNRRFEILARVLEDGYQAQLMIENLADFPGATYDTTNNIFSWTPARGYVESFGVGVSVLKELKIRVNAFKSGSVVYSGDHKVEIRVFRDYQAPTITSIDMPKQTMREGERMDITVNYTDKDADPNDRATWADVNFESLANTKSMAGLVVSRAITNTATNQYKTVLRVDLSDVELTPNLDIHSVGLNLVSRYGKSSGSQRLDLTVLTSFAAPITTWVERIEGTVDSPMQYKFVITDPKLEQILSVESFTGLPAGADIQCVATGLSVQNCTLTYTPQAGSEGDHQIVASVKGANSDNRDTFTSVKNLYLRMRVNPKGP